MDKTFIIQDTEDGLNLTACLAQELNVTFEINQIIKCVNGSFITLIKSSTDPYSYKQDGKNLTFKIGINNIHEIKIKKSRDLLTFVIEGKEENAFDYPRPKDFVASCAEVIKWFYKHFNIFIAVKDIKSITGYY